MQEVEKVEMWKNLILHILFYFIITATYHYYNNIFIYISDYNNDVCIQKNL